MDLLNKQREYDDLTTWERDAMRDVNRLGNKLLLGLVAAIKPSFETRLLYAGVPIVRNPVGAGLVIIQVR